MCDYHSNKLLACFVIGGGSTYRLSVSVQFPVKLRVPHE